jgi:ELWxxDGT repeat protein
VFTANDGQTGRELWIYDGSQVSLVANIHGPEGLWAVQPATGRILKLDPLSGTLLYDFPAPGNLQTTHTNIGLAIAQAGRELLYVNSDDDATTLYHLDPVTGQTLRTSALADRTYDGLGSSAMFGTPISVEPDTAPDADVNMVWAPEVILSAEDSWSGTIVSSTNSPFASTGAYVFGSVSAGAIGWSEGNSVFFRADFDPPVSTVSIDFINGDTWFEPTSMGRLTAYGADGEILEETVTSTLWLGESQRLTISRNASEIAYIRAAGVAWYWTALDNLAYSYAEPLVFLSDEASVERQLGLSGPQTANWTSGVPSGGLGGDDAGRVFGYFTDGLIHEFDPLQQSADYLGTLPAPATDIEGMAFDGNRLFVSTASGSLITLEPSTGATLDTRTVSGGGLYGLAASQYGAGAGSGPLHLTAAGSDLYFLADNGRDGRQFWRFDGAVTSRVSLTDTSISAISEPTVVGSTIFFAASAPSVARELWKLEDGVASLVADLNPGPDGSDPHELTAYGEDLVFVATDGHIGPALWRYDGNQVSLIGDVRSTAGAWGVRPSTGEIVKLDPGSGIELYAFDAPGNLLPGHTQIGLSMAEQGNALLFVNSNEDATKLYRVAPATGQVISVETLGGTTVDGVTMSPESETIYSATMSANPSWTFDGGGQWAWGTPTGAGGDPTSGRTGSQVVGYNLSGAYPNNMTTTYFARTPAINCAGYTGVTLSFYRWLGVESASYDHAKIDVSNNGSTWTTIWENSYSNIVDTSWVQQTFDISSIADNKSTVYIRWGMGPTDSSVVYSGWNIDDVTITGNRNLVFLGQDGVSVRRQTRYSGSETANWATGAPTGGLAGDGTNRAFGYFTDGWIHEFDPYADANEFISNLAAPAADIEGLAFDGHHLYASTASGRLYTLDPDTGAVVRDTALTGGSLYGLGALNQPGDAGPQTLTVFGDRLYFSADDGGHGRELWQYDGSSLRLVLDLVPGPIGSSPQEIASFLPGHILLSATDSVHGRELWSIGSTPPGYSIALSAGQIFNTADFGNFRVIDAGPDRQVLEGDTVTVTPTVLDPDPSVASTFTYAWHVIAANGQIIPRGDDTTFSFVPHDDGLYTVELIVTDSQDGATYRDTVTVDVGAKPPRWLAPAGQTADEAAAETFQLGSFVGNSEVGPWQVTVVWGDQSEDSIFSVAVDGPLPAVWHTFAQEGTYLVTVTVRDDDDQEHGGTFEVVVDNLPPGVAVQDVPAEPVEGTPITLTGIASDPAGDPIVRYTWTITKNGQPYGLPAGTATDESEFAFTPDDEGTYVVTFTARDDAGGEPVLPAEVTIQVANAQPTAVILNAPASAMEGTPISLASVATDPGPLDTIESYLWTATRDGQPFATGTTRDFSFTPPTEGEYRVTLTVQDNGGATSDEADVVIAVVNVPPTVIIAGTPATSPEGSPLTLVGQVADPGTGDAITYAWSVLRNGLAYDLLAGTPTDQPAFGFTPADDGLYEVSLAVNDGLATVSTAQSIVVSGVAPTAVPMVSIGSIDEGSEFTFGLIDITDPSAVDAASLRFSFDLDGDGVLEIVDVDQAAQSVLLTRSGRYTLRARVQDKDGLYTDYPLAVEIRNVAPVVSVTENVVSTDQGITVSFSGVFTDPGDDRWRGSVAITRADQLDFRADVPLLLGDDKTFAWDYVFGAAGTYVLTFLVTDDEAGMPQMDEVTVTVGNLLPVFDPLTAAHAITGHLFARTVSFTDPGNDAWTWSVDYGDGGGFTPFQPTDDPNRSANNPRTLELTHVYTAVGDYEVRVQVSDQAESADPVEAAFTVHVTANQGPVVVVPIPDLMVRAGVAARFAYADLKRVFQDADEVAENLQFTVIGNTNPDLVTVRADTAQTLDALFAAGQAGTAEVTIRAADASGAFAEDTFLVHVWPDLYAHSLVVPTQIAWGQEFTVQGRIGNASGVDVTADLAQRFYLSRNLIWGDADDVLLGQYVHSDVVAANAAGPAFDVSLTLPASAPAGYAESGTLFLGMRIDADAVLAESDEANNLSIAFFEAISEPVIDNNSPLVAALSPADDAKGAPVETNLAITFNEPIRAGAAGSLLVKRVADDSIVHMIDVTTALVTVAGATATFELPTHLAPGTRYYVELSAGAFEDLAGNPCTGITGPTAWNFDTNLIVAGLTPTRTGFHIQFSHDLDVSELNLYDQGGAFGHADLTLTGNAVGEVRGSLVIGPTVREATFIKTAGLLAPDQYTVTLNSSATAFRAAGGDLLDGDGDGMPGGQYVGVFTVSAPLANAIIVSLPNVTRGAGQPVNLPADNLTAGLPLQLSDGFGLSGLDLELHYDTRLLHITEFVLDSAVAARGGVAQLTFPSAGVAKLTVDTLGSLGAVPGLLTLGSFMAAVPDDAAYAGQHLLDICDLHVFDNGPKLLELPSIDDDAIHIAAFFGDANGDGSYNSPDATLTRRIIGQLNTGLAAYKMADPRLIVDITGDGSIQSSDTTSIRRAIGLIPVPNIPPLPTGPTGPLAAAADSPTSFLQDPAAAPSETENPQRLVLGAPTANAANDFADDVLMVASGQTTRHNAARAFDVNGDGWVTPLDVLLVIHRINAQTAGDAPASWGYSYDVNNDQACTALDALLLVNSLDAQTEVAVGLKLRTAAGEELADDAQDELFNDWDSELSPLESVLGDLADDIATAWR